jgi:hypothetical protein
VSAADLERDLKDCQERHEKTIEEFATYKVKIGKVVNDLQVQIPTNADLSIMTLNMNFVMETAKSITDMFAKWRAMQVPPA